jgi:hypothetical protein
MAAISATPTRRIEVLAPIGGLIVAVDVAKFAHKPFFYKGFSEISD